MCERPISQCRSSCSTQRTKQFEVKLLGPTDNQPESGQKYKTLTADPEFPVYFEMISRVSLAAACGTLNTSLITFSSEMSRAAGAMLPSTFRFLRKLIVILIMQNGANRSIAAPTRDRRRRRKWVIDGADGEELGAVFIYP